MNTNQTNRDAWRKFLGIKDPSSSLENGRTGGVIGRTAGRAGGAGGGGALDSDSVPEGSDDDESAEKGDGGADAGNRLKPGDDADRLEDLYDCETGEAVKIDGLGEKGSEKYPSGFQDCKPSEVPDDFEEGFYFIGKGIIGKISDSSIIISNPLKSFQRQSQAITYATNMADSYQYAPDGGISRIKGGELLDGGETIFKDNDGYGWSGTVHKKSCASKFDPVCSLPPPVVQWPAVDRNHLNWNKESGCFEPLCKELNTQVLDRYKSCEKERILCDKDGNKVKVEVDGNTVKVTQAKYNQTAEIKNGKVQTVKKLTESQTEAEFK